MKRLFAAILCLCLLAGCGRTDSTGNTCRAEDEPTVGAEKAEPIGESFRIIQEKPDWLLLAKEEGGSAEVYTLSLSDTELTLDGEVFERNEPGAYQRFPDGTLTGALVEVAYDLVLETYPGQLAGVTAVNLRSDGLDDRCALYLRVLAVSGNDDAFALIPRFIHNRVYLLDKRTGAVHHSHALFLQRIIQKLSDTVRTNHNRSFMNALQILNDMQSLFVQIPCYLLVVNQGAIGIQRCAVIFFYFRIRHLNRALHTKAKPCGCRQCYVAHSFTFNSSTLSIITFVISPISSVVSFLSRNSSNVSGSP